MIFLLLFPVLVLGEIQLQSNVSSNVTFEDNERFQEQEHFHVFSHCNEDLLGKYSLLICWDQFHSEMKDINKELWCEWDQVIRPYLGCYFPNQVVQDFFIQIHSSFFQACPEEEELFPDAPSGVVLTLTLIPVSLIPILVFLVVWKSKICD
uniref:Receptor activity-modifying protein 1 n=1 Tax=Salmo salar TaxID=8030 RepID=B5X8U7_SALSA|nr:Receptor activity-modifying protein 1 precursor [Salmo salar]